MQKSTIVALTLTAGLSSAADLLAQEASPLAQLVDKIAPSIVTVRVVAEITLPPMMGGEKHEMKEEALGTIVDASGLVLVPTAALDPGEQMSMMFGGDADLESNVTSLKVVIGNDNKELPATVVAKDDKLGFSYVKIADLDGRELTPLSFDRQAEVAVGTEVYAVRRLPEDYDFAPVAARNTIAGRIKKPRNAWVLGSGLDTASPVFTADGGLCGVVARIEIRSGDDDARAMMMRMLGGRGGPTTFVVGAQVASNSLVQALETAKKATEKPAEKPAEEPATDEPK